VSLAARLAHVAGDVRALGAGAPARGLYEASKRLGGHQLRYQALTRGNGAVPRSQAAFRFPAPTATAVERARRRADEIADGDVVLFGRTFALGPEPDWHAIRQAPGAWPAEPWWRIDLRGPDRPGDVKWAWELGRHRHLVVLARGCATPDPDPRWAEVLHTHLRSWFEQNPPETGVHWASNLEIALRALAWLEVQARLGDALAEDVRSAMDRQLHHSALHLLAELPYTLSTMRNNHVLGDAVGLVALGRAFAGHPGADRWERRGDKLLARHTPRIVRGDGSMSEDSLSYHRFVMELLAVRVLIGDPPPVVVQRLGLAARFLCRLGGLDGPVPQYGDWDEARALTSTNDPHDLAGSIRLALALAGRGAPPAWRDEHDEAAWYARPGDAAVPDPAQEAGHDIGGGMARAAMGPFTVWLKAGGGPSHGHADRCSVVIARDGHAVVGDPGTGAYNGDLAQRNGLRSSTAHSVLVLDGEDQLVPHRNFRWVHSAVGRIGPPVRVGEILVLWGAHDAYRRLEPSRRVARTVVLDRRGASISDWVEGPPGAAYTLTLAMPPGPIPPDLTAPEGAAVGDGPWSATYGTTERAPRLVATGTVDGPVRWGVGDPPEVDLSVEFGDGVVRLQVGDERSELVL
jgi:hypothetical protein